MKTKHTDGPWTASDEDGMYVTAEDGSVVCDMGAYGEIKPWHPYPNAEANARLIAAAPGLLTQVAVARGVYSSFLPGCPDGEIKQATENLILATKTVIARATGSDPPDAQPISPRLILAAPDLLAACEAALRIEQIWCPATIDNDNEAEALCEMRSMFRAAIAKATGEPAHA